MAVGTIKKLDQLISNNLKKSEQIMDTEITSLTKPGDNYGSIMLKLDITIKHETTTTAKERVINAVAKLIPDNEIFLDIFNTQVTYKNELEFYRTIVPTLEKFQQEHGVNVFTCVAKFLGGRINLSPGSERVDRDAVIVLENLRIQGYQPLPRTSGFDFTTAKLVIKHMSVLHALPLSVKLQKPKLFEAKIKPYLADFNCSPDKEHYNNAISSLIDDSEVAKKAFAAIERGNDKSVREPWGTLIQNDLWIGNTLIKFEDNEPVDVKILDFQLIEYKSPARDLVFFLFSSVKIEVLQQHLDELLQFYYENFIRILKQFKVDASVFTWESFNEELRLALSRSEYYHVLWMLDIIHVDESVVKACSEQTAKDFYEVRQRTKLHDEIIVYVTQECFKRGWI